MKRLIVALILIISGVGLAVSTRPALAIPQCTDYPTFPTSWGILNGVADGDHVRGSAYVETIPESVTKLKGTVQLNFAQPQVIHSVQIAYLHSSYLETQVFAALYDGPNVVDDKSITVNEAGFDWHTTTLSFENGVSASGLVIGTSAIATNILDSVAIKVVTVCGDDGTIETPYPSLTPSMTPTNTPTPTINPSVSPTPSPTTGPSLTPSDTPTGTIFPTSTVIASATPGGVFGGGSFATVAPPKACTDVYNPCGQLPFSVPPFATLNLPSPTALTQVPLFPTATLLPFTPGAGTGTPSGSMTPTGTTTPGTATPGAANAVISYATSIAGISESISGTPGVNGSDGYTLDLSNGANQIGQNMGDFVGIVRAIQPFFAGKTGILIAFLLVVFIFIVFVQILLFVIPIVMKVFQFLLMILAAIP